nr:MAG TPA: hypothetical protein [Caudoviricetes sp.]
MLVRIVKKSSTLKKHYLCGRGRKRHNQKQEKRITHSYPH